MRQDGFESDPIKIQRKRAKIRLFVRSGLWDLRGFRFASMPTATQDDDTTTPRRTRRGEVKHDEWMNAIGVLLPSEERHVGLTTYRTMQCVHVSLVQFPSSTFQVLDE